MRRRVRLTESDLHKIVKESVNRVLREGIDDNNDIENAMSKKTTYTIEISNINNSVRISKNGYVLGACPNLKYLAAKSMRELIDCIKPI
jgi:hypothetical protein